MIPDQIVEIAVAHRRTLSYYNKKGYSFNDELPCKIKIHLNDLPKGSSVKVNYICDKCGKLSKTFYFTLTTKENHFCRSCSRKGIEPANKIHFLNSELNFIEKCYSEEWMSPSEIGKLFGCSAPVISNALKNLGFPIEKRGKKPNLVCPVCNKKFKKVPSEIREVNCCSKKCRGIYERKRIELVCLQCKKTFKVKPHQNNRQFCSLECGNEYSKKGMAVSCKVCGKKVWSTPSRPKIYCSRACAAEGNKTGESIECAFCGTPRYVAKCHFRNELYFCSQKCFFKYRETDNEYYSRILDKTRKTHLKKWKEDIEWANQRRKAASLRAIQTLKKYNKGTSKIEEKICKLLQKMNIEFIAQKEITSLNYSIKKVYDIYLPASDTFIELHGGFWHADPRFYPDGKKLKPVQLKNIHNDRIKKDIIENELKKQLVVFWEHDILTNLQEIKNKILQLNNCKETI